MLSVGDKILYKVDEIVGYVACEVLEVVDKNRYRIRDIYDYTYIRYIPNPVKLKPVNKR